MTSVGYRAGLDCQESKPLDNFPRNRSRPDGFGQYCKSCFAERYRRHRVRKATAEGRTIQHRRQLPDDMKWCAACQTAKPVADFPRNRSSRDGLATYCKPCHNQKGKDAYERLYGSTREYHLRRRYGIGQAEVDAMIEAQGGTCAVCPGKPEHVDHDHKTGKVRGMLCFLCNQALGNARDDIDVLYGLIDYLRRSKVAEIGANIVVEAVEQEIYVDFSGWHAA
jgi:5-methylcytosine-specific restriction endonuclease McrA